MTKNSVKLGDLTSLISSGSTPKGGSNVYLETGETMLIRSQNVLMRSLDLSDVAFIDKDIDASMKRTFVKKNDVLLNITGASIGRVAVFDLEAQKANVNQHVCIIRPNANNLDSRYLMYFLSCSEFQAKINGLQNGGTRQALNFSQIREFPIPILPIAQQKRIAAILDKADAVRRKRREAIRLTEELLRSTFLEMFGDPITNPKGWEIRTLQSVCSRVTVGYVGSMSSEYQESGIPWLRSLNVKRNYISFSDLKYVSNDFHQKLRKSSLKPGNVVIVRTGKSGVASVIPDSLPTSNCSDLIVTTCDYSLIDSFFLSEVLNVILGDRDGGQDLTGAIQKHFNIKRAQKMNIPLPDMQLQKHWRAIYQKHQVLLASLKSCVQESENLFNSLLQRAFTGNL